ncbi:22148_t:CDS:2, partial [Cetraspora pellucida]
MSQQNKNKQENRIYYPVKNTEVDFLLSENLLINSINLDFCNNLWSQNESNNCTPEEYLEWKGEKSNSIDFLDEKLFNTSNFNTIIKNYFKELILNNLNLENLVENNINIPSLIYPDTLDYL